MTTPLRIPGKVELRPGQANAEIRAVRAYGRHYKIKRWGDRPEGEQYKISCALSAFQSWRRDRGEPVPPCIWDMSLPDVETLQVYLALLSLCSRPWRDMSVAALRLYFLHHESPQLFRLVEVKLVS